MLENANPIIHYNI